MRYRLAAVILFVVAMLTLDWFLHQIVPPAVQAIGPAVALTITVIVGVACGTYAYRARAGS